MRRIENIRLGRIDYLREGYRLDWDTGGINITATDYHCETLHLPWRELLELMASFGYDPKTEAEVDDTVNHWLQRRAIDVDS
jgi:hypothetical protein